jgi:hypothetical protein
MEKMKDLYVESSMIDIIRPVANAFKSKGWEVRDGKIFYTTYSPMDNGWNLTVPTTDRDCIRWLHIFFNAYGIIPKPCFGCFKVVVLPRTLEELMRIKGVQENMGMPAKCGIELRGYVPRAYGAYWYAPLGGGLEVARNLLNEVKKQIELEFGKEDPPFALLKRACTEMERAWGPSNEWAYTPEQAMKYELLEASYGQVDVPQKEPSFKRPYMFGQWIEYAMSIGDATYKKYAEDLVPTPVDYTFSNHGLEEEEVEIIGGDDE